MSSGHHHVCPARIASLLDTPVRRLLQKPERILAPYVRHGMTVLDLGCGPGFFSLQLAHLVGPNGQVIACDVQPEMLRKVESKLRGSGLENRVRMHLCRKDSLGIAEKIDFVFAFYMMHEVSDQPRLLNELAEILQPSGQILIVEPPLHVSRRAFTQLLGMADAAGWQVLPGPKLWPNQSAVLRGKRL